MYFAAAIAKHHSEQGGGWRFPWGGGVAYPWGGLTLVFTWLMASRGEVASMGGGKA